MKKLFIVFVGLFLLSGCFKTGEPIKVDVFREELPLISKIDSTSWSFIDENGNLFTWGVDGHNNGVFTQTYTGVSLGQGTEVLYNNIPTKVYSQVAYVILGNRGLTKSGEMIEWNKLIENDPCVPRVVKENIAKTFTSLYLTQDGELYTIPLNEHKTLKNPYEQSGELIMTGVKDFAIGYNYFALKDDGSVWAFLISSTTLEMVQKPLKLIEGVEKIIANPAKDTTVLFLKKDGTLWSCGDNEFGQCGNGEHGDLSVKTHDCVVSEPYKMAENVSGVWQTYQTTFYLTNDHKLYACGKNGYNILLTAENDQNSSGEYSEIVPTPTLVMEDVRQMGCSDMGMFILKTDDTLWSWGYADKGTLGNGVFYEGGDLSNNNFTMRLMQRGEALFSRPSKIMDGVKRLYNETTGLHFAQKLDGTVWYWGYGAIYVDQDDKWDTELEWDNYNSFYLKHYIIPKPIEFSVDTYFQTALDYIAAQGVDVSQYEAVRTIND